MPEVYLNCNKCGGLMLHLLRWDNTATCQNCHDTRDLDKDPPKVVQLMKATSGRPEKRV